MIIVKGLNEDAEKQLTDFCNKNNLQHELTICHNDNDISGINIYDNILGKLWIVSTPDILTIYCSYEEIHDDWVIIDNNDFMSVEML